MPDPPSGTVTFLFTDVEGSTKLWESEPERMKLALAEHDQRMRSAFNAHGGYVFATAGDSFAVAFDSAVAALEASLAAQISLLEPAGELTLKVRMGMHSGTANLREGDYFGVDVNRCARVMAAGHGGQLLLSRMAAGLVADHLPDGVELVDLGEHRLKDLAEPERIFQVRHPHLDNQIRRLRALSAPARELPRQLTSFVGRLREASDLGELLAANRLVTVTGVGGAGKTRLALHAASELLESFPDGIYLVELAAVTQPDVALDEVGQVFGLHAAPGIELVDTMIASIGERRALLLLDNCEHLLDTVALLVYRLLAGCSEIKVLATSRALLGVEGEAVYHVPALQMPPVGTDPVTAMGYDAVRLFIERARLANSKFEFDHSNVAAVVDLCRQLDGIPLALELAAARLRVMSPAQIVERLDERFRLLVRSARSGGDRQQTLQATIDWSYGLLEEHERVAFRRLSWFTGSFSLDAARVVGGFDPLDEFEVIENLSALVDKSMVAAAEGDDGAVRYRLLESVRHYGRARLGESTDEQLVAARHRRYYADFAEALQVKQRQGRLAEALAQRDQDESNLRAALRSAIDDGDGVLAARTIAALGHLWYSAGLHREGIEWCRELAELDPVLDDQLRAGVLHTRGTLVGSWADPAFGAELLAQEVELRRTFGDPVRLGSALNNFGNLQLDLGLFDEANATIVEAIALFREGGASPGLSMCSLAHIAFHQGMYEVADERFAAALEEGRRVDDPYVIALTTLYLGVSKAWQGETEEGRRLAEEGRAGFEALKVAPGVADADFYLAMIDRSQGRLDEAAWRLLASLAVPEAKWYQAAQFWNMQVVASIIDDCACAAELLGAAAAHYERATEPQPAFVIDDLGATRAVLEDRLGSAEFAARTRRGGALTQAQAVASAITGLHRFIDRTAAVDVA
ncbi:MAG TPA: adenylate/guanylate cyclase domain-containing protein [Ilumatobacter sp.]